MRCKTAAAEEVLHRRELLLARLRSQGALAFESGAKLSPALVSAYLTSSFGTAIDGSVIGQIRSAANNAAYAELQRRPDGRDTNASMMPHDGTNAAGRQTGGLQAGA